MNSLVIINADDLGLTTGVNRGIFEAIDAGVVSDASLMANGEAFDDAAKRLIARGMTGIGLHVVLVDAEHALTAPTPLADQQGRFFSRNILFLKMLAQPTQMKAALRAELGAQHQRVVDAGLHVTHLDSHQHVHLFPGIANTVVDFCHERRIVALRLTTPLGLRSPMGGPMKALSGRLRRAATRRGVATVPALGFETGGRTTRGTLERFIAHAGGMPVCELIVHPGRIDDRGRERYGHWHYDWDRELDAILGASDVIQPLGRRLISYCDLPARAGALM